MKSLGFILFVNSWIPKPTRINTGNHKALPAVDPYIKWISILRFISRIKTADQYGEIKIMFKALEQIMFSPGPFIFSIRQKLKNFTEHDYLLLNGDPAIIGVACSIVSDITNGKYKLLKWDKQERRYYPIEIDLYQKESSWQFSL